MILALGLWLLVGTVAGLVDYYVVDRPAKSVSGQLFRAADPSPGTK